MPKQQHEHEPPRRRTRRRALQSSDENTQLSLADFIHRAKVMKQYRNFVRLAQYVDGKDSGSTEGNNDNARESRAALDEVRISYKTNMRKGMDVLAKNMAFAEGERRLRELERTVGYRPAKREHQHTSSSNTESSYEADSWINIQDADDPRGRMGVQWPWERANDKDDVTK